jgi:hypothetical protein
MLRRREEELARKLKCRRDIKLSLTYEEYEHILTLADRWSEPITVVVRSLFRQALNNVNLGFVPPNGRSPFERGKIDALPTPSMIDPTGTQFPPPPAYAPAFAPTPQQHPYAAPYSPTPRGYDALFTITGAPRTTETVTEFAEPYYGPGGSNLAGIVSATNGGPWPSGATVQPAERSSPPPPPPSMAQRLGRDETVVAPPAAFIPPILPQEPTPEPLIGEATPPPEEPNDSGIDE